MPTCIGSRQGLHEAVEGRSIARNSYGIDRIAAGEREGGAASRCATARRTLSSCRPRWRSSKPRLLRSAAPLSLSLSRFTVVALAWASFGKIDIIATAQGKIMPTGRTKVIQPLEASIVTAIHVRDGDKVHQGDVLLEIDRTISTAERNRIGYDYCERS